VPVTLETHGIRSEMPGRSDPLGIDVVGDSGFDVRVVLDAKSRCRPDRSSGPPTGQCWTTFHDRRAVGIKLPYHVVTTAGDRVVDDISFDEIRVNPPLSKTDFAGS
jgi:hypothetical protein